MNWSPKQWMRFFGVVNNVIGLTASEKEVIKAQTKLLLGLSNDDKYVQWKRIDTTEDSKYPVDHELFQQYGDRLQYLIMEGIYEQTESLIVTAIIMNSWSADPHRWNALLRNFPPES